MEKILIGTGKLHWLCEERSSDRYGLVNLWNETTTNSLPLNIPDTLEEGVKGELVCEVIEVRESEHIGDLFRGIYPEMPKVGEIVKLGKGRLIQSQDMGIASIGIMPLSKRKTNWLNPHALYRVVSQTVNLFFIPA